MAHIVLCTMWKHADLGQRRVQHIIRINSAGIPRNGNARVTAGIKEKFSTEKVRYIHTVDEGVKNIRLKNDWLKKSLCRIEKAASEIIWSFEK